MELNPKLQFAHIPACAHVLVEDTNTSELQLHFVSSDWRTSNSNAENMNKKTFVTVFHLLILQILASYQNYILALSFA